MSSTAKGNRDRRAAMQAVAANFGGWRPRREVLTRIKAVPTWFPQYDEATGVGGHPLSRLVLVHGPSNHGKSEFCLGLGAAFLAQDHFFGFIDAERTTPEPWLYELMGELADHPGFSALSVGNSYEQTRAAVRRYCEGIAEARVKEQIPPDTTGLVVLDSIRKLVPEKLWAELAKEPRTAAEKKKRGVDGYGGRAGQMKAALNAAWVDELAPLLADTRMAMVVISRETEDTDAEMFADEDYKVGGGSALVYDASLRLRVLRASTLYLGGKKKDGEDNSDRKMIGERHRVEVRKTKLARKFERVPCGYFHTSNGVLTSVGFDRARDIVEQGLELGVLELAGAYVKYEGKSLGQGEDNAVVGLYKTPDLLVELERQCRLKFRSFEELTKKVANA